MSSKPSIPPRPRNLPQRSQVTPSTGQPGPTLRSHRDLVRKPRSAIVAFGVAAIVITGTIFGAQLKSSKQVVDRSRLVASQNTNDASTLAVQESEPPARHTATPRDNVADDSEILQAIKLLEDRKATLNRQKHGFESKLEALHERKRKREAQAQAPVSR